MTPFLGKERRRRIKPPRSLIILGWVAFCFPLVNYFYLMQAMEISWRAPAFLLLPGLRWSLLAMVIAPVAAIGLLRVKKWGWFAFLFFGSYLVVHNGLALVRQPGWSNLGALASVLLGLTIAIYICQKDVAAPYFRMYPRGWRLQKRSARRLPLLIDSLQTTTTDVSPSGFYAELPSELLSRLELGQALTVLLDGEERDAGLVRKDEQGAGFAFRKSAEKQQSRSPNV